MTFLEALVAEIEAEWTGATLYFQQPSGAKKPFIVLLIVPPNDETPEVFCRNMGEAGEISLQWSYAADSAQATYTELEAFKNLVQGIRGLIGTAPDEYRISANRTGGVQSFDAQLGTWSAIVESTIRWHRVT